MFPLQLLPQGSYLDQLQKSLGWALRFTCHWYGTTCNAIRDNYSSPFIHKTHKTEMQQMPQLLQFLAQCFPCYNFLLWQLAQVTLQLKLLQNNCTWSKLMMLPRGLTLQWRHNPWEGQVRGTVSVKFLPRVFMENSQWKQAFSGSKHTKVLVAVMNHVWRSYLLLPGRACPPRVLLASGDLQKLPWGEVQRWTEFSKSLLLQSRKNVIKCCCCESGLKYYLNHTLYLKIYEFKYDFMVGNVSIYNI